MDLPSIGLPSHFARSVPASASFVPASARFVPASASSVPVSVGSVPASASSSVAPRGLLSVASLATSSLSVSAGPVRRRVQIPACAPYPVPGRRERCCSVDGCPESFGGKGRHEDRHIFKDHLPWWLKAHTACWHCKVQFNYPNNLRYHLSSVGPDHPSTAGFGPEQMQDWIFLLNGLLHLFCSFFCLGHVRELLAYVRAHHLWPTEECQGRFSLEEQELLRAYEREFEEFIPGHFTASPPVSVSCLSHWRVLVFLLNEVSPAVRDAVSVSYILRTPGGRHLPTVPSFTSVLDPSTPMEFIDTHFHLDLTLSKLGCRNFGELERRFGHSSFLLLRAVANFVFPSLATHIQSCVPFPSKVVYSIGFHPSVIRSFLPLEQSVQLLTPHLLQSNCVGVGEVGLDLTKSTPLALQVEALRLLLPLAHVHGKVLILHCRDSRSSGQQAADTLLSLLQELALTHLPIHFHSFNYSRSVAEHWLQVCPKVHFGLSAIVIMDSSMADVVAWLPRDRILLETDAPYLAPPGVPRHRNNPWQLCYVMAYVARQRNVSPAILLGRANANACALYNFPV